MTLLPTEAERVELRGLTARRSTAQAVALRARIVLACAQGTNQEVAAKLGVCEQTVSKWRRRFAEARDGETARRTTTGRPADGGRIEAVITRTLESVPPDATHWSSHDMARASGLLMSSV